MNRKAVPPVRVIHPAILLLAYRYIDERDERKHAKAASLADAIDLAIRDWIADEED